MPRTRDIALPSGHSDPTDAVHSAAPRNAAQKGVPSMNRFSTLAKLADSMLTTPGLPTWTTSPRPAASAAPTAPTVRHTS